MCHWEHPHIEFSNYCFEIGGNSAVDYTWEAAYAGVPTNSVRINQGFSGPCSTWVVDIGANNGTTSVVGGIDISDVNNQNASGALNDNVTGRTLTNSWDSTIFYHLGMGNNPPVITGEGGGGQSGPVALPAASCTGGIGQTASTIYYLPPYNATSTGGVCTDSTAGVGFIVPHLCMVQNLTATMDGPGPASGNSVTISVYSGNGGPALGPTCNIAHGHTSCSDTNSAHNVFVSSYAVGYSSSASNDSSAKGIHVMADCW
jgi:hypothetical protein